MAAAHELGLDRDACTRLHLGYFEDLVRVAWQDGKLTVEEREDLELVARLLDIPGPLLAEALERPPSGTAESRSPSPSPLPLRPGVRVAITGETNRPREEWYEILEAHGLTPWNSVTKQVALLIAADPDSVSGKARKAREYGIPIVNEEGAEALLARLRASN